jgi:hypothetical protein
MNDYIDTIKFIHENKTILLIGVFLAYISFTFIFLEKLKKMIFNIKNFKNLELSEKIILILQIIIILFFIIFLL